MNNHENKDEPCSADQLPDDELEDDYLDEFQYSDESTEKSFIISARCRPGTVSDYDITADLLPLQRSADKDSLNERSGIIRVRECGIGTNVEDGATSIRYISSPTAARKASLLRSHPFTLSALKCIIGSGR